MAISDERLAYKAAVATQDWAEAVRLKNQYPDLLGEPIPDVPDGLAAVASDPMEPGWMVVDWSVQKNDCKDTAGCKEYLLRSRQIDHISPDSTDAEVAEWFARFIENRREHAPAKDQLGQTLYLVKVERIVPITDFEGKAK